ncbi:MAG: tripartite tricarboxylate transporter TctB family protein [Synergistes sp.]|nr:tripartite tricarboxylate transporter TctB family protein [Synergistes sp.]
MKFNKDKFFAVAVTLISALLTAQAFSYPYESSQFPRFLCILMLLFSAIMLIKNLKSNTSQTTELSAASFAAATKIPVAVFGSVTIYVVGIAYIGYFVSTALFMALTMIGFGERKVLHIAAAIAVFLAVVYALFVSFLGLRLPEGLLF